MVMQNDGIQQIIAEIRSLVRQCDQGQALRLQRLASPLPPMLQDNTEQVLHGFYALTRFDPFDNIDNRFSDTEQRSGNAADPRLRSRGSSSAIASHEVTPSSRGNSGARQPVALPTAHPLTSSNGSAVTSARQASEISSAKHSPPVTHKSKKPMQGGKIETQTDNDAEDRNTSAIATKPISTKLSTAKTDNASSITSQQTSTSSVTTRPLITKQSVSSQKRRTTTLSKALSHIEALTAMRKAHAKERHKTSHKPNTVQRESNRSLSPDIGAGARTKDKAVVDASSPASTPNKTTGKIAGVPMQVEVDKKAAIPESPAAELATHPQRGLSNSQPIRAATPTSIEELDVKAPPLASPDRLSDSTPLATASLPEENVAQQLADALYLHGIDRT